MDQENEIISELYLRLYDFLLDYAEASLKNRAQAEEAVQETFQIACQKREELCAVKHPEGWILNQMKTVLLNTLRDREADSELLQRYVSLHLQDMSIREDSVRVEILYGDLAEREELKLIKELALDGYSYLEMAQKRGISVATCRKRVQRAREALRKKLIR